MSTNETARVAALEVALREINPTHPLLDTPPPTEPKQGTTAAAAAARGKKRYRDRMGTPGAAPGPANMSGSWTTHGRH